MTVYNIGAINGAEVIAEISGVEVNDINEINNAKVEHLPLNVVVFYYGTISGASTKSTELASMPGWYVCNGVAPTDYLLDTPPDYLTTYQFLYCDWNKDDQKGYDTRQKLNHTHSMGGTYGGNHNSHAQGNSGSHSHDTAYAAWRYAGGGGNQGGSWMETTTSETSGNANHSHYTNSYGGAHSNHSIGNSGSASPDNRPAYKTLIPLIRLRSANYNFPIGTVLWYDANDITDPATRSDDLSDYGLPGWYVMNGNGGSQNFLNKFVKCEDVAGNSGGTDTAVNVEHNHTVDSQGSHRHYLYLLSHNHTYPPTGTVWRYAYGAGSHSYNWATGSMKGGAVNPDPGGNHSHTIGSETNTHDHGGTSNSSGSGDADNRPAFYSMLLIERVS